MTPYEEYKEEKQKLLCYLRLGGDISFVNLEHEKITDKIHWQQISCNHEIGYIKTTYGRRCAYCGYYFLDMNYDGF